MKKLILTLILATISLVTYSQMQISIYVVGGNFATCPYSITTTWTDSTNAGTAQLVSIDTSFSNQTIWYYQLDSSATPGSLFTACVIPTPNCNCQIVCVGPTPVYQNTSLTVNLCPVVGMSEIQENDLRTLIKVTNINGQKTTIRPNELLIYWWSDGTIQRKIIIE